MSLEISMSVNFRHIKIYNYLHTAIVYIHFHDMVDYMYTRQKVFGDTCIKVPS